MNLTGYLGICRTMKTRKELLGRGGKQRRRGCGKWVHKPESDTWSFQALQDASMNNAYILCSE